MLAIPFENLSLRLATAHGVSLEPQRIFDKLVTARRGGYCFEQNGLFGAALRGLGFDVIDGAARVVQGSASAPAEAVEEAPRLTDGSSSSAAEPLGVVQPRVELRLSGHDHHILFVRLGGRWWLVDVGFGGDCLPLPLLLPEGAERYAAPPPDETADAPYLGQGWADGLPVGRMARYRLRLGLPGLTAPPDAAATPHFALRAGYYLQYRSAGTGEWRDLYFFR